MARVDRRGFLRAGGQAVIGVAGILGGAPASWAARELSILTAVNYAPTSDAKLDELGKRFSKLAGANVKVNHVQSVQMPAKLSSELLARSGHDIMSLEMHYPWLFPLKSLVQHSHLYGWPAPPDERIQLITNTYIIPNMFARVVTNAAKPKEAILGAETEIKRMFDKK